DATSRSGADNEASVSTVWVEVRNAEHRENSSAYQAVAQSNRAALSRSSATPSAATSLSISRLYVARIRGGLSGHSSSAGSPPSLRRSLRARRLWEARAATKSDGRRAADTASPPSC